MNLLKKYRVALAALLGLLLVLLTGGVIKIKPNTGEMVEVVVPAPKVDDDDSGEPPTAPAVDDDDSSR